ncbi:Reverse transcriptase (RNA-dependent DNA polymerase) [Pseudoxanthomonas sp. GM95]|uniref:retron Ec67 family RNA-directed DNA polymerase/endonuclease n=1 Tax=Pseudoxanthomonas sp. GM95 TaxID=1881043 RepID=UPI0008D83BB2|nr:retron Ec67 family RNA-directed DNA polymerase/endonuclease [Pseudoxanthomonas sp. GM95]SEK37876.1 Reverse transcriptase (RNA-dependent DNA polymerase) [Pseudoxanthomonas sp. GM95]
MSNLSRLHACTSVVDLANLLGFQAKALGFLAWGLPPTARYSTFDIPKRSGGKRTINAPIPQLKLAQQKLAAILQSCEAEIELLLGVKRSVAHGFKPNHSILTNAAVHRRQRYILNFDLEDFFGTIHFGRVRGFLITNRYFKLHPDVATLIAQLCCHQNQLPQGAPTSPVLSNLIGKILDVRLSKLARIHGCAYTRYADDITMSTSAPEFPAALATECANSLTWQLSARVTSAIADSRFKLNPSKTRLQHRRSRQDVTGIVVNQTLNANSDFRRSTRAMVDKLCRTGCYQLVKPTLLAGDTVSEPREGTNAQLHGKIGFLLQVERFRRAGDPESPQLSATEKLLKRFLFYTTLANAERPVILFEGKTDEIYLRCAIKRLASAFPRLAAAATGEVLVNLFSHTPTRQRIFGLTGGDPPLTNFVNEYREHYRPIKGPKGTHPVIVLYDNDNGANSIFAAMDKIYKVKMADGLQFIRIYDNLYIVLSSAKCAPGTGHCIEHLFDKSVLTTTLSGKTLSLSNKPLKPTEYGKAWFAEKVIKTNYKSIDFSGFHPLLEAISTIVTTHKASSSPLP